MSEGRRVLVTGGTGFLGRAILRQLADCPDSISLILHHQPAIDQQVSGGIYRADLAEIDADHPAFASVDTVVHAAVDYSSPPRSVEMVRRVLAACRHHGVERIVYISSHNAGFRRPGPYSQGKIQGERLVQESGLTWVILRPTLLYCSTGGPFLTSLIRLARRTRIIPVLGRGSSRIQPAHRRDVAAIAATALQTLDGRCITIGGAESISLRELARSIRTLLGPSLVVPIPIPLLRIPATVHPTLREKLQEIREDKTLTPGALRDLHEILGRKPRTMKADLPSIVSTS